MSEIQLVLANLNERDVSFLHRCYTSREVRGLFQPCRNVSRENVAKEISSCCDIRRFVFIVRSGESDAGCAYAHYIQTYDHYEIGASLLPAMRGRGIGTAAHKLLIHRMFRTYEARRLHAIVSTRNCAEMKVLESCRFTREGVVRSAGFLDGVWHDLAFYGLLSSEFREPE